jgi:hypothetical protein
MEIEFTFLDPRDKARLKSRRELFEIGQGQLLIYERTFCPEVLQSD